MTSKIASFCSNFDHVARSFFTIFYVKKAISRHSQRCFGVLQEVFGNCFWTSMPRLGFYFSIILSMYSTYPIQIISFGVPRSPKKHQRASQGSKFPKGEFLTELYRGVHGQSGYHYLDLLFQIFFIPTTHHKKLLLCDGW